MESLRCSVKNNNSYSLEDLASIFFNINKSCFDNYSEINTEFKEMINDNKDVPIILPYEKSLSNILAKKYFNLRR